MYEETREIIKDTLRIPLTIGDRPYLISDILEHIMIGYIFEVEIEQIADQVLAILLTPAQIAEWKAGGKVGVIARDQEVPKYGWYKDSGIAQGWSFAQKCLVEEERFRRVVE